MAGIIVKLNKKSNAKFMLSLSSLNNNWLKKTCLYSTFKIPEKKEIVSTDDSHAEAIEGRENPEHFSSEYVPGQVHTSWHKNKLMYKLQRMDCLRRRQNIKIPEFYPGSILGIVYSDHNAPDKKMRFVGRCIYKDGFGTASYFCLRNVVDGEAAEIEFLLYDPMIIKYDLIKLEKWIDTDLRYLRNAESSICTIDFDMIPETPVPPSQPLPVFKGKVKLHEPFDAWEWQFHRSWPRPYNAYLEEHFVAEEFIANERFKDKHSWRKYDICRHHDFHDEKNEIINEMKANKTRIEKVKNSKNLNLPSNNEEEQE